MRSKKMRKPIFLLVTLSVIATGFASKPQAEPKYTPKETKKEEKNPAPHASRVPPADIMDKFMDARWSCSENKWKAAQFDTSFLTL